MAFDLTRSYFNDAKERAVAAGVTIAEEGQLLMYVDDGSGGLAVTLATDVATARIAGFAITDALKVLTETVVEEVVVPAGGGSVNLRNQDIVTDSESVEASTTGTLAENCPTPGAGDYCLDDATGIITFEATQAGETVTVQYRHNLTLQETLNKYHERSINNRAQDLFSSVSVAAQEGEMFTSMYDTSVTYAIGDEIRAGAAAIAGSVTNAGAGKIIGFVSQVPSTTDGFLGVKFDIPVS
jgi:hypothetical protein